MNAIARRPGPEPAVDRLVQDLPTVQAGLLLDSAIIQFFLDLVRSPHRHSAIARLGPTQTGFQIEIRARLRLSTQDHNVERLRHPTDGMDLYGRILGRITRSDCLDKGGKGVSSPRVAGIGL